jgi:excisionase family DNA binding protein
VLAAARPATLLLLSMEGNDNAARDPLPGRETEPECAGPHHAAPDGTPDHRTEVRLGAPLSRPYVPQNDPAGTALIFFSSSVPAERAQLKGVPQMATMAVNELGKMLTASEVAEMLHLHVNTVKRLGDRGELKYYKVCKRGDRRFLLEDVRRFLDNNR